MQFFHQNSIDEKPGGSEWISDWANIRCQPMELNLWWRDILTRARPGFLGDSRTGQYFVALFVDRDDRSCLALERLATFEEAHGFLADFASQCPVAPERLDAQFRFDDRSINATRSSPETHVASDIGPAWLSATPSFTCACSRIGPA